MFGIFLHGSFSLHRILPEHTVDLIHYMAKFIISICGGQLELNDEPIHFIDADSDGHTFLNGVFDETLRVQHHL